MTVKGYLTDGYLRTYMLYCDSWFEKIEGDKESYFGRGEDG